MMLRVAMMSGIIFTLSKLHSFSVPIAGLLGKSCPRKALRANRTEKFSFKMPFPARRFDFKTPSKHLHKS